jgi:hypothetical protein
MLHVFGTFAFTLFFFSIIHKTTRMVYSSKLYTFIFITSLGVCLGVLFELIEFTLDILFKANNQRGLLDTNLDLIANVLGAILAGVFAVIRQSPSAH